MDIELFKSSIKRNHTSLFIIYSAITLTVYLWFWVFSRKKIINQLSEYKINEYLPAIFVISAMLSSLLEVYGGSQLNGGSIIGFSVLFQIISTILMIVIAFQMKKVLKEFSDNNEIKITYNDFFTFLFNFRTSITS